MSEEPPTDTPAYLEGLISVWAALESGSRPIESLTLRQDKDESAMRVLERTARDRGIAVTKASADEIDRLAGGRTHGGVLAQVGPRRFAQPGELIEEKSNPWLAMIDEVEEPFNFGAAVRCLYAAGCDGLVLRPRNWMSAAGVVARASAGASERIPTAIAETLVEAAGLFAAHGLKIVCATERERGSVSIYDVDLTIPLLLVVGGEKRGITRSFRDGADLLVHVPYGRTNAHALGTASAVAVIAFEIFRQRAGRSGSNGHPPSRV